MTTERREWRKMTQSEMALQALWTDGDPAECQVFRALSTKCSQTREQI